ncbi:MAG: AraC family transcriptional regulator [Actinomycetaceae bacterium]|nr:AraC family transcriptional regulator [Actinomycetaceae bacterium]
MSEPADQHGDVISDAHNHLHTHLPIQALRFLRAHYAQPLTIYDLADHLAYSESHITRLFSRYIGFSPVAYLSMIRLHEAKRLLLLEDATVAEACYEVGYSSVGTFTRRFTKAVGVAPGLFRRSGDRIAESTLPERSIFTQASPYTARIHLDIPQQIRPLLGPAPFQWIGTFSAPIPHGLPYSGTLRRGIIDVEIPIFPHAHHILATVTPSGADPEEHLAPLTPFVALGSAPLQPRGKKTEITLSVHPSREIYPPLLVALAAAYSV